MIRKRPHYFHYSNTAKILKDEKPSNLFDDIILSIFNNG